MKVFLVEKDRSEDGRGQYVRVGAFTKIEDAKAVAFSLEPYKHANQLTKITELIVYDNQESYILERDTAKIQVALAKLSTEEKNLLGLL